MLFGEILQVALAAIRVNKLRSFLTMLGIIMGVGAVITMVALGTGAQRAVQERIQAMGPTLLSVYPGQMFRGFIAQMERVNLTMDDAEALARDARHITDVVPEISRNLQVKRGNQNINVSVVGTTPNYVRVRNYTIPAGRMFTPGEDEARRLYAVLGSAILGAVAIDACPDVPSAVRSMTRIERRLDPRSDVRATYDRVYRVYAGLYPALRPVLQGSGA